LECCCRKLKKNPQNTNGRLAIPAPAGLLVTTEAGDGVVLWSSCLASHTHYVSAIGICREFATTLLHSE